EASRPGASVAAVADRHGMSRSLLFEWRRQVREGTMPGVMRADAAATLVPVRIVEEAPPKKTLRRSAERTAKAAAAVEVVLSNGRMLRVSEAIAPEVLGRLVAALDG
ncbi:IS66-like element accessory protein TnpA, partial [Falsiroseomonas sp. HW251]|uniref:IS66-like element accessory protein TnpA n=1 Tax=Falsiroseomonas sp. HW251 TaxID=3390998 RepID=UPI003D31B561